MDSDEQRCIDGLQDRSGSDADHISCIEVLEVLLSLDALPVLVEIMGDDTRSFAVRQRAAMAINELGVDSVKDDVLRLAESVTPSTRELANLAVTGHASNKVA